MAFKYLSWLLYPLLGCYAVYSLLYVEHKGWYSWILGMLYGFLLTFGESAQGVPLGVCRALGLFITFLSYFHPSLVTDNVLASLISCMKK